MDSVILNGYEVMCDSFNDLINKALYAIFAKDEIQPRRIFDDITDVWNYCYSHERGD